MVDRAVTPEIVRSPTQLVAAQPTSLRRFFIGTAASVAYAVPIEFSGGYIYLRAFGDVASPPHYVDAYVSVSAVAVADITLVPTVGTPIISSASLGRRIIVGEPWIDLWIPGTVALGAPIYLIARGSHASVWVELGVS